MNPNINAVLKHREAFRPRFFISNIPMEAIIKSITNNRIAVEMKTPAK